MVTSCFILESEGSKDWPVDAAELQSESQQLHTESAPYISTHLRKTVLKTWSLFCKELSSTFKPFMSHSNYVKNKKQPFCFCIVVTGLGCWCWGGTAHRHAAVHVELLQESRSQDTPSVFEHSIKTNTKQCIAEYLEKAAKSPNSKKNKKYTDKLQYFLKPLCSPGPSFPWTGRRPQRISQHWFCMGRIWSDCPYFQPYTFNRGRETLEYNIYHFLYTILFLVTINLSSQVSSWC